MILHYPPFIPYPMFSNFCCDMSFLKLVTKSQAFESCGSLPHSLMVLEKKEWGVDRGLEDPYSSLGLITVLKNFFLIS